MEKATNGIYKHTFQKNKIPTPGREHDPPPSYHWNKDQWKQSLVKTILGWRGREGRNARTLSKDQEGKRSKQEVEQMPETTCKTVLTKCQYWMAMVVALLGPKNTKWHCFAWEINKKKKKWQKLKDHWNRNRGQVTKGQRDCQGISYFFPQTKTNHGPHKVTRKKRST